jgi:hypothetical protein
MLTVNGSANIVVGGISLPIQPAGSDVAPIIELVTKFTDLGELTDPQLAAGFRDKFIDGVRLEIEGTVTTSMQLYVGTKERLKDLETWYGPYTMEAGDDMVYPNVDENRYIGIKIVDQLPTDSWKLTAIELFGVITGGRQE